MKNILNELNEVNEKALNGEANALEAYINCKQVEKLLKNVMNGLHEAAIEEAEKYGKGEHEAHGAKFQVKNGAARYDFKTVSEWVELKAKLTAIETERKALVKVGQNNLINADTGAFVELPVQTFTRDSITIKL